MRRRRWRLAARIAGWSLVGIIGLVTMLISTAIITVHTRGGSRFLLDLALRYAREHLAGRLEVGRLQTNLWNGLELDDIELRDPEGELAIRVARLKLRFSLLPLFRHHVRISSVDLQGGDLRVRTMKDGRINVAALLRPTPPSAKQGEAIGIDIGDVRAQLLARWEPARDLGLPTVAGATVVRGAVRFDDRFRAQVDLLEIGLSHPGPAALAARGGLTVEDGVLRFEPTSLVLDAEAATIRAFLDLPRLRGRYRLEGGGHGTLAALVLDAILRTPTRPIAASGTLAIGEVFGWKGKVRTRDLDPEPMWLGAPHARLWLEAEGQGHGAEAAVAIAHAQVASGDNRVHMSGKLYKARTLEADLEVEVAAPRLDELHGRGVPPMSGALRGKARVRYGPPGLGIDGDLRGRELVIAGLRARELSVGAQLLDLAGKASLLVRDLHAGALRAYSLRADLEGDRHNVFMHATAAGSDGTSIDLGLRGTPIYDEHIPTAIDAELIALDVDRRGQRLHAEPGARVGWDGGLRVSGLRIAEGEQRLALDGRYDPNAGTIDATVKATALDAKRLVALFAATEGVPTTHLDLDLRAKGPLARPEGQLALRGQIVRDPNEAEERLDVQLAARAEARKLAGSLRASNTLGSIALEAALPRVDSLAALRRSAAPISVRLGLEILSLRKLVLLVAVKPPPELGVLDGRVRVHGELTGTGQSPALDLRVSGDGLEAAQLHKAALQLHLAYAREAYSTQMLVALGSGSHGPAGQVRLRAAATMPWAALASELPWRKRLGAVRGLDAELGLDAVAVERLPWALARVVDPVEGGKLDGTVALRGNGTRLELDAHVAAADLRRGALDGVDAVLDARAADGTTRATLKLSVRKSPLAEASAQLACDLGAVIAGTSPRNASLSAHLSIPGFDLAKVGKEIAGAAGLMRGQAAMHGSLARPSGSAQLDITGLALGQTRFDRFALESRYGAGRLQGSLIAHQPAGGRFDGTIGYGDGSIDAALHASAFQIDFASAGDVVPVRALHARVDGELVAAGRASEPSLRGELRVVQGKLAVASEPRELDDLTLVLSLAPGALRLQSLSAKLGPGRLDASGQLGLDGLKLARAEVVAHTKDLPVVIVPFPVVVDSRLELSMKRDGEGYAGTLRVEDGAARIPSFENVRSLQGTGPLKDVVFVDARGRAAAARKEHPKDKGTPIALEVIVPGPFHVRSKELAADLKSDLTVRRTGEDLRLNGTVEALPNGHLILFNRRYELDRARASFSGGRNINPALDIRISRELADAVIIIGVEGRAQRPKLRLSSEPPVYSESQIMMAVLSGDPGAPTTDRPLEQKITGALSSVVVGAIKDQLAPQLPIDVLQVEVGDSDYTGLASTRLEVGKYLTDAIYVGYVHQFGALQIGTRQLSANRGDFEWRFRRRFALRLGVGDAPEGKADLFWTLRF